MLTAAREGGASAPLFEPLPQLCVVAPCHNDEVYPSFREELAAVPVNDLASWLDQRFELIEELRENVTQRRLTSGQPRQSSLGRLHAYCYTLTLSSSTS